MPLAWLLRCTVRWRVLKWRLRHATPSMNPNGPPGRGPPGGSSSQGPCCEGCSSSSQGCKLSCPRCKLAQEGRLIMPWLRLQHDSSRLQHARCPMTSARCSLFVLYRPEALPRQCPVTNPYVVSCCLALQAAHGAALPRDGRGGTPPAGAVQPAHPGAHSSRGHAGGAGGTACGAYECRGGGESGRVAEGCRGGVQSGRRLLSCYWSILKAAGMERPSERPRSAIGWGRFVGW